MYLKNIHIYNIREGTSRRVHSKKTLADFLANPIKIWECREPTLFSSESSDDIDGMPQIPAFV
jgi:hypothetical protein